MSGLRWLPAAAALSLGFGALGCAAGAGPGDASAGGGNTAAPGSRTASVTPRSSQGTLRQQEITVELRVRGSQVRLTPLDTSVTRLTAPDTRRRLASLVRPGTGVSFLVSVFTTEPAGADFEPQAVSLENRGRVFRPTAVRPLTPGWGARLVQDTPQQAVYTFPDGIDLEMPLTVEVAGVRSDAWTSILPRLDAERARLRARGGQTSSSYFRIFR